VKAIRTEVGSIKKVEGNWRLIKWFEANGDLKSKRQMDQKNCDKTWIQILKRIKM
jgi:hypothetical protein